jgi:RHS repeat-associated protein
MIMLKGLIFSLLQPSAVMQKLSCAVAFIVGAAICGSVQAQDTTRVVEYSYNATTGLLEVERVDPGGTHCVETVHTHDAFGNKASTEVRPCAVGPTAATTFDRRRTEYAYLVKTSGTAAQNYPAGAYLTSTTQLRTDNTIASKSEFDYDPRFGKPTRQTEVAHVTVANNNSKRTEYDDFGRVFKEYVPVSRSPTTTESYVEHERVYCDGPFKLASDPICINYEATDIPTQIDSWMLTERQTGAVIAKQTANTMGAVVSAYYVRSTPRSAGAVIGARTVTHFDSLHRAVAKESEGFDGRWSVSLAAFNNLGMEVAKWSPYFGRSGSGALSNPSSDLRQWTSRYDLLHRPVQQSRFWRDAAASVASVVRVEMTHMGLSSTATIPADSSPDGVARSKTAIKYPDGKVAQSIDPYGATVNHAYDASGNLVRTVDALGNTTTISYTPTTARFKIGMTDPNQGTWSYSYDALGQLRSQTDAIPQQTQMAYDVLGRMISRTSPTLNSFWYYDKTEGGAWCAAGMNRICGAKSGNPANAAVVSSSATTYDNMGRPLQTTDTIDRAYVSATTYDSLGRVSTFKYPTNFTIKYGYSSAGAGRIPGVLEKVSDNALATRVFWSIDASPSLAFDANGNLLRSTLGNGLATDNVFDPISGKAFNLRAGSVAGGYVSALDYRYTYDKSNNIFSRNEAIQKIFETFEYDKLDRLTKHTATVDGAASRSVFVQYNAIGNILSKTDVGGYTYAGPRPHAMTAAAGVTYGYDANGQLVSASGDEARSISWTSFNHVESLTYNGATTAFKYDPSYRRVSEVVTQGTNTRTVYFVHPNNAGGLSYEREETRAGATVTRDESRHYVSVGGSVVAVVKTLNNSGTVSADNNLINYWHKDALGSVVAVSNQVGVVLERMVFDPWGRRVRGTGVVDPGLNPAHGDRGFTGHEHLDEQGLVHMNGRIYNPLLGRFLSPDPYIQDPNDLQNFNRYSYVLNNPLKYTDPSGELWQYVAIYVISAIVARNGNEYWQMVGQLGMFYGGAMIALESGVGAAIAAGSGTAMAGVFALGAIGGYAAPGATAEDAMLGGLSALAFAAIGTSLSDTVVNQQTVVSRSGQRMLAHAMMGCIRGLATGGKCGPSAAAALFSKGVTEGISAAGGNTWVNGIASVVAGGTISYMGGGKFSNGAITAAYQYLFNEVVSTKDGKRLQATGRSYTGRDADAGDEVTPSLVDKSRPMVGQERHEFKAGLPLVKFLVYFVPGVGATTSLTLDALEIGESFKEGKSEKGILQGAGVGASSALEKALTPTTGRAGVIAHIYNSGGGAALDAAWEKFREPPRK